MTDNSVLVDDAEWEILADDWWHTPLSSQTISWSFPDRQRRPPSRTPVAMPKKKVLPYHNAILRSLGPRPGLDICCGDCQEVRDRLYSCDAAKQHGEAGEVELNREHGVVKMAMQPVAQFERTVAIAQESEVEMDVASLARRVSLLRGDVRPSTLAWEQWNEKVEALLGGIVVPLDSEVFRNAIATPASDIPSILDLDLEPPRRERRTQVREVIDLTDSEQSVESEAPPSTPKPTDNGSLPQLVPPSPSSPSTSSFSPPTSDEIQSDSSITTRSSSSPPSMELRKDEQGFFISTADSMDEPALLPSFLVDPAVRRKPHSRTREIIDRLRLGTAGRPKTAPVPDRVDAGDESLASPPSTRPSRESVALSVKQLFQKGSDGWIRMSVDAEDPPKPRYKSDAFFNPAEDSDAEDSSILGAALKPSALSKKKSLSGKAKVHNRHASVAEGWIETESATPSAAASTRPSGAGHAKTLSNASARRQRGSQQKGIPAPGSVGVFTFPPPPPSAPNPPNSFHPAMYGAPGYPMPPYAAASAGYMPVPYGYPAYPMVAYPTPPYMPSYGVPPARPAFNPGTITGAAGIRHANW
ncbi:hypothetical protein BV25DRAFT_1839624 [Artomyces pyxidatus]|uniref:Uncharacterized protein n=1 Tax=Artomyces pyxidatus TaxID=48021 RepID=A0ACB8SVG6_9AGAM|nr:hypothetical protein BV25DRAFT_1839624 [Artomyces pyxidatus]